MKFGIYSSIADPPRGERLDQRIDEVIAEARLAEEVGFDSCFFGEHHQDPDGFLPSPLIVATAVAAQTSTLKVGTSVILLPLHNPVHLAEDVITLDLVSKGRIILGVGLGYQEADFRAFEVPVGQRVGRFEEGVEIIRHCWSGEPFSFHGEHHQLENLHVRPSPFQQPAPPLWIGPSTDLASTIGLVETYREAAVRAGREPLVALMRDAWVAETRAEAAAVYGPEVMTAYMYYWRNGLSEFRGIGSEDEITLDNLGPDRLILGEPDECVAEFRRWSEAVGAEYLSFRRNPSEWTQRISLSTKGRNYARMVCTQIYPGENDLHVLGRGMAPALQIGRMKVPPEIEAKYNEYYDTVRTPANLQVPGCGARRRYHAVEGEPKYMTVYEFEHEKVPETQEWRERRGQDRMHEYIGGTYGHAPGSAGVYRRILPARAF